MYDHSPFAGLAAPLFIIMLVIVFVPWLLCAPPFTLNDCVTAAKAHGGCWCSMRCQECWAAWRKWHGLRERLERGFALFGLEIY